MRTTLLTLALFACADGGDDVPDPPGHPCAWDGDPALEAGRDIAATGLLTDDTPIDYGNPPQGGAPYAPFQVRVHADYAEDVQPRLRMLAVATARDNGEELGSADQIQTFFCSNTGVHDGWYYGGEVHVRFWDRTLESLEGRAIDVTLSTTLDDGAELHATGGGTLMWTLGR